MTCTYRNGNGIQYSYSYPAPELFFIFMSFSFQPAGTPHPTKLIIVCCYYHFFQLQVAASFKVTVIRDT